MSLPVRAALYLLALVLLVLALAAPALAQRTQPSSLADPYYAALAPQRGAYYDPLQPGAGVLVDIGIDGTMFVGVFHHDLDGRPSFHTMQGRFEPAYAYPNGTTNLRQRPDAGAVGTLRSPLYLTTGGDCLDCPFRATGTIPDPAYGTGELTFTESRRARLRVGTRIFNLQLLQIDRQDADLVTGRWLLAAWEGSDAASAFATVEIAPVPAEPVADEPSCCNVGTGYPRPSANARLFTVTCVERCASFDAWRGVLPFGNGTPFPGAEVYIWYEPASGKAVLDQFVRGSRGLGARTGRRWYELSLDLNLLTGRASYRDGLTFINTIDALPREGLLVQLMRLPRGKTTCAATGCP